MLTRLFMAIRRWWSRLTTKATQGAAAVAAPLTTPLPSRPAPAGHNMGALGAKLGRIHHGGKHYGSKRKHSQHRGTGRGKRSGRA